MADASRSFEMAWKLGLQLLIGLGLTLLFLYVMSPFLVTVVVAGVLAMVSYPLYARFLGQMPRALASVLVTLVVVCGVLIPLFLVLYSVSAELLPFVSRLKVPEGGGLASVIETPLVRRWLSHLADVSPLTEEWLNTQALATLRAGSEKAAELLASFLQGLPRFFLGFFIVVICIYFFLADGEMLMGFVRALSPWEPQRTRELYRSFEESCRGVVLGFLASGFTQGILVTLIFLILSIPKPLLMGAITVVVGMIPILGGGTVMIGGGLYLLFSGDIVRGLLAFLGAGLVGVSDNFVRAWVMKGQSRMHPLLALLSAFGAVDAIGVTGVFLGPIIAGVFVAFTRVVARELAREKTILGPEGGVATEHIREAG